ncbi:MAG: S8 family serine peptidase [Microcoleaceae cyanobacterium]
MVFVLDDANSNVLIGTAEIDELFGLGGADSISGGEGFDLLFGNQDNDTIWGEVGDDIVYAGRDNDLIFGGLGNDRIFGDVGNDTIHGDKGTDILTGGIGSDIFLLQEIAASFDETDIVSDFKVGEDLIQIASDLDLEAVIADSIDSGNSTLLRHPDTKEFLLILQNVSPESLTSGNFDPALEIIIPSLEPPVIIVPEIDDQPPTIEASLVNDTGLENNDGITSDPTITGRATDNRGMPWVEVNFGDGFVSVGAEIEEDGSFRIEQAQLEQAFGGSLADGDYNLLFRSVDLSRLVSPNFASVDFTLDTTAPEISAELANNTGEADGITTDPKVVGTVTEANITALRAGSGGNLQDVSNLLDASGDFEFGQLQLEAFLGTSLTEGTEYTLELEAEDALGQVAATELSFTLATSEPDTPTPPEEIEEIIDGDEEPLIVERVERNITEEPGNTLENASRIAVTSNTSVYSGEVSGDGLEDFYTFTLGATTNLSLDLTGSRNDTDLLEADADLLLLDSNGDEIDSSETIGINSESITRPLEAGTYFIQVESFDGIPTDYKLAVSANSRLPGITTTGAEGEGEFDVVESNVLINLEAPETDPSVVAFRNSFSDIDGSGFSVVVLDSGLDLDHPFFGGNGDGEISDRIVFQFDYGEYDADASDFNGHGSNVTSIIASEDDTYTGIAPGANIIHLKVGTDEGGPSRAAVEQALQWVTQNVEEYNIASVNMSLSLGGSSQEPVTPREIGISDELAELAAKNVIVVSSSGNDYPVPGVKYPSSDPNSLSVGAVWDGDNGGPFGDGISGPTDFTTGADRIVSFSQRDPNLTDIFAPGAFITGANQNGETVTLEGTSQAAPHITGVAVLAQQLAMETIGRRLDLGEFRTLLQNTGVTIFDGDENGNGVVDGDEEDDNVFNTQTEYKRVDVLALGEAILALDSTSEPPDQPELVRYDFAYYYDLDSLRTEDVYQGYTYAEAGLFDLGELGILYDPFSGDSEVGTNGQYYIFDDSGEVPETALSGEV